MKKESKVAWLKAHPWNQEVLRCLRSGLPVSHRSMLAAVQDPDNRKVFDLSDSQPLKKENHVIFQYAIVLQRSDGRVAVFERAAYEQGQERITRGRSILISNSSPDAPYYAAPALIHHALCVGRRKRMAGFSPRGMVWNALPARPNGKAQPTYLFALYSHVLPDDVPLHGRFKESPDTLVDWVPAEELPGLLRASGYIDQLVAAELAGGAVRPPIDEGDHGIVYSPTSFLQTSEHQPESFLSTEYAQGNAVFISHASEDSFSAYALYRFLTDESSRSILAMVDLMDIRDGDHLAKIERLIRDCDGVVLVITPNLLQKSAEKLTRGEVDWVKKEIDWAKEFNKPIIGFKVGTMGRPEYLPEDLVANNKSAYGDWLHEVRLLVQRVRERFNLGGSAAK